MKVVIPQKITEQTRSIMQKVGYFENYDHRTNQVSYIHRLSKTSFYPRFHCYINEDKNGVRIINLHLDQKQPSYAGASAHNAEYDSEVVVKESDRIKDILENISLEISVSFPRHGEEKKEGFFSKIWRIFRS